MVVIIYSCLQCHMTSYTVDHDVVTQYKSTVCSTCLKNSPEIFTDRAKIYG